MKQIKEIFLEGESPPLTATTLTNLQSVEDGSLFSAGHF